MENMNREKMIEGFYIGELVEIKIIRERKERSVLRRTFIIKYGFHKGQTVYQTYRKNDCNIRTIYISRSPDENEYLIKVKSVPDRGINKFFNEVLLCNNAKINTEHLTLERMS